MPSWVCFFILITRTEREEKRRLHEAVSSPYPNARLLIIFLTQHGTEWFIVLLAVLVGLLSNPDSNVTNMKQCDLCPYLRYHGACGCHGAVTSSATSKFRPAEQTACACVCVRLETKLLYILYVPTVLLFLLIYYYKFLNVFLKFFLTLHRERPSYK